MSYAVAAVIVLSRAGLKDLPVIRITPPGRCLGVTRRERPKNLSVITSRRAEAAKHASQSGEERSTRP